MHNYGLLVFCLFREYFKRIITFLVMWSRDPSITCIIWHAAVKQSWKYLLSQPPDVFEVGVCGGGGRGPQVGVDVSQGLRQQSGDVGVDGSEPGVGSGAVFTAQHHRVLAVWRVELQQSERQWGDLSVSSADQGTEQTEWCKHLMTESVCDMVRMSSGFGTKLIIFLSNLPGASTMYLTNERKS